MIFDMHCHTKEGSLDAKVGILDYVKKLKSLGFDGMLVTDHNSYKGYEHFKKTVKSIEDFVVLKGIEYDTKDGGHMIAILPEGAHSRLLELRGMTAAQLEKVVHKLGGIFGPAHPYGPGYFAVMNTRVGKKKKELFAKFDFIEVFNACTKPFENEKAKLLAKLYEKPMFSGSDAHRSTVIGAAFTEFFEEIRDNDDLIAYVKAKMASNAGGRDAARRKSKISQKLGVWGYWFYNKLGSWFRFVPRKRELKKIDKEES